MSKILSNQEPKGTSDWTPAEFLIRKYIFDTWRKVCLRYGFEEYLTPLVESAEVYRAKSGEDVGGKELVTFKDLGGRELSIRPEMTPSVVRMVTKTYATNQKPLKYFSIANFMRNEKPQRGRNREFWQLNCDIFGNDSLAADIEILQLALDIMLEFDAPQNSFVLYLNDRKLIEAVLDLSGAVRLKAVDKLAVVRTLDKWDKLNVTEIRKRLAEIGLDKQSIIILENFMASRSLEEIAAALPDLKDNAGFQELAAAINTLSNLGYGEFIEFNPTVIRGFDYYDGLVFEIFGQENKRQSADGGKEPWKRALFGGGRYNGLAEVFGSKNFPAVGFAPGDETTRLFLADWNLLDRIKDNQPTKYYLPLLAEELAGETAALVRKLRAQGKNILSGLDEQKIGKALEFANKKNISQVIIFGSDEAKQGIYKIKDMKSGSEKICK